MARERNEGRRWYRSVRFWLGIIVVIVVVCSGMSVASLRNVPQVNDPPDPIMVPELAGSVPPFSEYSEFNLGEDAIEVEFELFMAEHTPSYKVINQRRNRVTAFLVTSEVCAECPGKKQDIFAERTLKEVDTNRMEIDYHEFSSDGTVTIHVSRHFDAMFLHVVRAIGLTFLIVLSAAVVWFILYNFRLERLLFLLGR